MKVVLTLSLAIATVVTYAACDKLELLRQAKHSPAKTFTAADEKAFWDLTYLKDAGIITGQQMDQVLLAIEIARSNEWCSDQDECFNARPIIENALNGEKILDDILHGFAGTAGAAERIGRAAREALERNGEAQSREARRRAERRFRDHVRENGRGGARDGRGDASRVDGIGCRRC